MIQSVKVTWATEPSVLGLTEALAALGVCGVAIKPPDTYPGVAEVEFNKVDASKLAAATAIINAHPGKTALERDADDLQARRNAITRDDLLDALESLLPADHPLRAKLA